MAVKIRLSRKGRKQAPFYHIVIADARSPRDGKFIEKIGTYNPMTKPATIEIDRDSAYDWLQKGAQPTDTVKAILRFKGVYYKKHLMRGVKKGAMTVEQADTLWQKWNDAKESKISSRRNEVIAELEAFRKSVSGDAKKAKTPVADASAHVAAEAFKVADSDVTLPEVHEETQAPAVNQTPIEEVVSESVPVVEASEDAPIIEASEDAPVIEAKEESPSTEELGSSEESGETGE